MKRRIASQRSAPFHALCHQQLVPARGGACGLGNEILEPSWEEFDVSNPEILEPTFTESSIK